MSTTGTDAVTKAAMERTAAYLEEAQPANEREERIATNGLVTGFRWGAAWSLRTTTELATALADRRLRDGVEALNDLMRGIDTCDEDLEDVHIRLAEIRTALIGRGLWVLSRELEAVMETLGCDIKRVRL